MTIDDDIKRTIANVRAIYGLPSEQERPLTEEEEYDLNNHTMFAKFGADDARRLLGTLHKIMDNPAQHRQMMGFLPFFQEMVHKYYRNEEASKLYAEGMMKALRWYMQKGDKTSCEAILSLMAKDKNPRNGPLFDVTMLRSMVKYNIISE